jgi:phosphoribosylglycinamide formyltransferase 1
MKKNKPKIIIFASGGGSNARKIIEYAIGKNTFEVAAIFCNNKNAGIIDWANSNKMPIELFTKIEFLDATFLERINKYSISHIVLAGFLLQVPPYLINEFAERIINIHPALLPKYGGKGMYGHFIHEAVKQNKEQHTGITIHLVNEKYDDGRILKQVMVPVLLKDTAEDIAKKVLELEHLWFAKVIEQQVLL